MAAKSHPRKLPFLKTDSNHFARPILPNDFKSATFNVVFVHLKGRCTLASCAVTVVAPPIRTLWAAICPDVSKIRREVTVRQRGLDDYPLFFSERKRARHTAHTSSRHSRRWLVVRNPTTSGPRKGHIPSEQGPSHTFCRLFAPTTLTVVEDTRLHRATCKPKKCKHSSAAAF